MNTPYVSEFCACIRHPVHEAGKESTFHVVITKWEQDLSGEYKPRAFGPVTPEDALKFGFDLPAILGEISSAAIRERDEAIKRADETQARLVKLSGDRSNAIQERADAIKERDEAKALVQQLQTSAQAMLVEKDNELSHLTEQLRQMSIHNAVLMQNAKATSEDKT